MVSRKRGAGVGQLYVTSLVTTSASGGAASDSLSSP
jgi:hypothetical protein